MSRRALILNSASGGLMLLVSIVLSFIMSPFLVHQLGNAGYGFWELILGLVGYLGILDAGVGPAVLRFVAVAHGSGDRAALSKTLNAGFASFLLAGVVGACVILMTAIRPAWLFGEVPVDLADARIAIMLAAMIFLLTFCRATFSASLMGLQYHRIVNVVRMSSAIVGAVLVYEGLPRAQPHALVALACIALFGIVVELSVFSFMLLRYVDRHDVNPLRARWQDVRQLLTFGVKSAGLMTSSSLIRQGILFVLSHTIGAAAVTFYTLAGRLVEYSQQLTGTVGFPLTAYFATTFGSGGVEGARGAWLGTTRVIQFVQAGVAMGVVWLGLPFLSLWMGPEYARQGGPVFYFLCGGLFVQVFSANANRLLVSLNLHGRAAVASVVVAAICVLVAVVVTPRFGLGGAASAVALFMSVTAAIEVVLAARALGLSPLGQVRTTLARYAPPVVAGSLVLAWLARVWPIRNYGGIPVHALASGLAYVGVAWFSALRPDERRRLALAIRSRLPGAIPERAGPDA